MASLHPSVSETSYGMRFGTDTRHGYTTGGDENLLHTKVLGYEGFGSVHEVECFFVSLTLDAQRPSWTGFCEKIDPGSTS